MKYKNNIYIKNLNIIYNKNGFKKENTRNSKECEFNL